MTRRQYQDLIAADIAARVGCGHTRSQVVEFWVLDFTGWEVA